MQVAKQDEVLVSHGQHKRNKLEQQPIRASKNNISIAAKKAFMGSYGVIPGPIDGIAMNHPDRGQTKTGKSKTNNPNWNRTALNGLTHEQRIK